MGGITLTKSSFSATHLPVKLKLHSLVYDCEALVDSGAEGNFLDINIAHSLKIPMVALSQSISVVALNGQPLPSISNTTVTLRLITSGNHSENIDFLHTETPSAPVVLGHPWLELHNPHINWHMNSVFAWSEYCHASCLLSCVFFCVLFCVSG